MKFLKNNWWWILLVIAIIFYISSKYFEYVKCKKDLAFAFPNGVFNSNGNTCTFGLFKNNIDFVKK